MKVFGCVLSPFRDIVFIVYNVLSQALIKQMIAIEPSSRPTFDSLLHTARGTVFPESFYSFLHNYVASINEASAPSPFFFPPASHLPSAVATPTTVTPINVKPVLVAAAQVTDLSNTVNLFHEPLPSDSDHRMEKIWSDYESVEPYLLSSMEPETLDKTLKEPVKLEFSYNGAGPGKAFQVNNLSILLENKWTDSR